MRVRYLAAVVASALLIGSPLTGEAQQRSMARTWAGLGLMAGGAVVALTGTECQVTGSFQPYSTQLGFLGSVNLTGREPVLSPETCGLQDFTIAGNVGIDTLNRKASEYNQNALQREIKTHIEADVRGEKVRKAPNLYGGLAMIGVGALIATVWADAPDVQLDVQPGGVRLSKTFGF